VKLACFSRGDSLLFLKRASARLSGNRFMPGPPKESPAEAGFEFEKEKESETPRLKAGAKKSPLKRAEVLFQYPDFWILLGERCKTLLSCKNGNGQRWHGRPAREGPTFSSAGPGISGLLSRSPFI